MKDTIRLLGLEKPHTQIYLKYYWATEQSWQFQFYVFKFDIVWWFLQCLKHVCQAPLSVITVIVIFMLMYHTLQYFLFPEWFVNQSVVHIPSFTCCSNTVFIKCLYNLYSTHWTFWTGGSSSRELIISGHRKVRGQSEKYTYTSVTLSLKLILCVEYC